MRFFRVEFLKLPTDGPEVDSADWSDDSRNWTTRLGRGNLRRARRGKLYLIADDLAAALTEAEMRLRRDYKRGVWILETLVREMTADELEGELRGTAVESVLSRADKERYLRWRTSEGEAAPRKERHAKRVGHRQVLIGEPI